MFWSQQQTCLWHAINWLWTRSSQTIFPANEHASTSKVNTACLSQCKLRWKQWPVPQKKIHCLQPAFQDGLVKCGVSCDGTWQRRGFSFLDGCVTAISMDTGKILDVLRKVIVKQSRPLKQSHCYKMSITRAIRNPLGWYFQWYHNELDPVKTVNIENS